MGNLMWKIREAFSKIVPIAIVVGLLYGGYSLYRKGVFRGGVSQVVSSVLHRVPYFGSRFSHYWPSNGASSSSFAAAPHSSSARSHHSGHRRHGGRHHGRRHHRR